MVNELSGAQFAKVIFKLRAQFEFAQAGISKFGLFEKHTRANYFQIELEVL